ncbi:hypothetical protein CspeluHIS016_0700510 [Cutaneotrichosporon spelunceum]|uniref:Uncharacterized protein n=1 Tax=Cutaneotrichosporon spelunceum TaxID=1672016 RepID=A0AAD3TY56_9TREE|nr:hypothetical protein CspeluHIS016_0700510 [Cutaneotrichosporon spelunceum]
MEQPVWPADFKNGENTLAHVSPDGVMFKPFHLRNIGGRGCTPARDTLMYRTLEWVGEGWPPENDRRQILHVDLAVGLSKRRMRAAGALEAEPALVLDGITGISRSPDALEIESALDFEAAQSLSPSEVQEGGAVLQSLGIPNHPNGVPVGLARLTDDTVPDQVYAQWRRDLDNLVRKSVPHLVAQLLLAHEACGAVHGASVVGGSLARFYVLGAGCIATDLGDPTGQTREMPLLARPGTTLGCLLNAPVLPALLAAENPGLACAWDLCSSPQLGPAAELQVPFGEGLDHLASMLASARARVESSGSEPARLPTILQDVLGAVKGPGMVGLPFAGEGSRAMSTASVIDDAVRMIPVTANEMTRLIESAGWIPQAMYASLENLTSGFEASAAEARNPTRNDSAVVDRETSAPANGGRVPAGKGEAGDTKVGPTPNGKDVAQSETAPDAWWQDRWSSPPKPLRLEVSSDIDAEPVEAEEIGNEELDAFKLGLAGGTEDELFNPEVEFFVSIDGVEDAVSELISADGASESESDAPATPASLTSNAGPSSLEAMPVDGTAATAPTARQDAADAAGADEARDADSSPKSKTVPGLPPHLAALQALYDLESDVVKTSEVTTKVDVPGMRPPTPSSFRFRGSSGAGPRRPGEERA